MNKEIEITEGHEARIDGNKVIIEPKENNDEKIRKSLVEYFRRFNPKDMWDEVFSIGDVLSYLERQKEHQNNSDAPNESSCEGTISSSDNGRNLDELAREYIDGVKQYHPTPSWDLMHTAVCYGYHLGEEVGSEGVDSVKPAEWSEEDEKMLNNCVSALKEGANGHAIVIDYGEHEIWLKSLPERFNLQPKQEWSKEEKERIRQNGRLDVCYNPEKYGLCHKTEWGEGEMEVLDSIINDYEMAAKSFCGHDGKIMFLKAIRDGEYDLLKQEWSEEDEPQKELAETYLAVFEKKFPILPTLKGKQLADYKNFLNKCQQILGLKYWGIRPLQAKLFEKLSLLWTAWGAEHLKGLGQADGDTDNEKQEWSEEDEKTFNSIFNDFKQDVIPDKEDQEWLKNRLKSLRPQPHWKPSEEQMKALFAASERNDKLGAILNNLYNGLKKL